MRREKDKTKGPTEQPCLSTGKRGIEGRGKRGIEGRGE
jgi:hypothetical protein